MCQTLRSSNVSGAPDVWNSNTWALEVSALTWNPDSALISSVIVDQALNPQSLSFLSCEVGE